MTLRELVSKLAKLEGLKKQVSVGNIRELVGLISDEIYADYEYEGGQPIPGTMVDKLYKNGKRRARSRE